MLSPCLRAGSARGSCLARGQVPQAVESCPLRPPSEPQGDGHPRSVLQAHNRETGQLRYKQQTDPGTITHPTRECHRAKAKEAPPEARDIHPNPHAQNQHWAPDKVTVLWAVANCGPEPPLPPRGSGPEGGQRVARRGQESRRPSLGMQVASGS